MPPTCPPALRRGGYGSQLHLNPTHVTLYYFLNTRLAPFNDLRVRRAVNYAVDRSGLVKLFNRLAPGRPNCQVLPPNVAGYARYCPYAHDLAKAKRLVAASGTFGQTVTLWQTKDFGAGSYLLSVLASLGYKARLKLVSPDSNYYSTVADSRNQVQVGPAGWNADFPSASDFFSPNLTCASFKPHTHTNGNFAAFCNPTIDREISQARTLQTADPQAAVALWSKIDREVVDQSPWVAYDNIQQLDFVSRRVGDYTYNPQWGPLLDQLWVR